MCQYTCTQSYIQTKISTLNATMLYHLPINMHTILNTECHNALASASTQLNLGKHKFSSITKMKQFYLKTHKVMHWTNKCPLYCFSTPTGSNYIDENNHCLDKFSNNKVTYFLTTNFHHFIITSRTPGT
jgi:hypothetical protein